MNAHGDNVVAREATGNFWRRILQGALWAVGSVAFFVLLGLMYSDNGPQMRHKIFFVSVTFLSAVITIVMQAPWQVWVIVIGSIAWHCHSENKKRQEAILRELWELNQKPWPGEEGDA
jgi:hypothetical protein